MLRGVPATAAAYSRRRPHGRRKGGTHVRDLQTELESWDGYPPVWRPAPGEVLVGTIEAYDKAHSPYGEVRTVTIRDEQSGERVAVWLSSTVFLQQFEQGQPALGDRVGLKYSGKHLTKGYHQYRLIVERELDFSPVGGEADVGP